MGKRRSRFEKLEDLDGVGLGEKEESFAAETETSLRRIWEGIIRKLHEQNAARPNAELYDIKEEREKRRQTL